ncbi:Gfo/Idh/MocA family protein [Yunchengibacter salinarum]|uniref:Gfo/Idh/MocA family protein n=1 Tax=Yunchengibacter salinarum TaxID=3133399 RepID=UPI0035B597C2
MLNWGILGTAKIAEERLVPAMRRLRHPVRAVASRSGDRASAFARKHGIDRAHDNYEALLADSSVTAVYIPLPHVQHVPYAIRALEAGKHVLVEKPVALDAESLMALQAASEAHPDLFVMEAFMYRFHPQWRAVQAILAAGEIGPVTGINGYFTYFKEDPSNIRFQPELGAGVFWDIGAYLVDSTLRLMGQEPSRIVADRQLHPDIPMDVGLACVLTFDGGLASLHASMRSERSQRLHIMGERGQVEIMEPFNQINAQSDIHIRLKNGAGRALTYSRGNAYVDMLRAFAAAVEAGQSSAPTLADSLRTTRVLERIQQAASAPGVVEGGENGHLKTT